MRKFKGHLWPPDGHRFVDRDGFVHIADNWKALEAGIIDYRQRNHFPIGDVWDEMTAQVAENFPWLVFESS